MAHDDPRRPPMRVSLRCAGSVAIALQLALTPFVLTTIASASEDRAPVPSSVEPRDAADARADASTNPPSNDEASRSRSKDASATSPDVSRRLPDRLPSPLPKKLLPRSLPEVDVAAPPLTAPSNGSSRTSSSAPKNARAAGKPVEVATPEDDFKARLGSQSARGGGVFGRFDGLAASKTLGKAAQLSLLGGFPLAASNDARFDPNRSFYAVSLDLAPFDDSLAGRVFGVQQRIDEERERRAVGAELGLNHARGFSLVTVDYDVDFQELGLLSLLASTQLGERTTLNAFIDTRRYSNAPSAYSVLQSQSAASVEQLLDKLSQSEIRAPSFDTRTETRTVTLGAARQLTPKLQLTADVTLKERIPTPLLSTPDDASSSASRSSTATEQLDYSLRATWKDFLIARSSTTAALRIAEMAEARRYAGSLGGEYPLFQNLRVGPDLAFEFAEVEEEWTYKPAMRFEYLRNRLKLDLRLGLEITDAEIRNAEANRTGVFYRVGYRYDF